MTSRSRTPILPPGADVGPSTRSRPWLVAVLLALAPATSLAQDATSPAETELPAASGPLDGPLYRDPDPSEGARIQGPLLSARPPSQFPAPPPPPSNLGPFQPSGNGTGLPGLGAAAGDGPEPVQQPLLVVPPTLPPMPATTSAPMLPDTAFGIRRSTQIRSPNGMLGTFADWFHDTFLWPDQPYEYVTLPATLLWKPPTANLREPQFYGIFHNMGGKSYIDTAIGAQFGLGRIAPAGRSDPTKQLENEGIQLDVFGAVFTRFDPKRFLTAADYRAGIPLTYKKGPWSTKLSYEHTSTHIGDEYSQAYHVKQKPLVLDEVVYGLSRYFGDNLRLYGQIGYAFNTAKETNANNRTRFDWGVSYTNYYDTGPVGRPFAAYDMDIRSYQSYTPNNSFQVGWQWVNHGRDVRLAVQVFSGRSMFGQFYTHNESWVGFGGYYSF
jgi:Protein of unknown function (DUF1207)